MAEKLTPTAQIDNHAFKITSIFSSQKKQYEVTVGLGSINNIVPNNIVDDKEGSGLKKFLIQENEMYYVKIIARSNGNYINSATINIDKNTTKPSAPIAFGLPSTLEVLIGGIYNDIVYQSIKSNIQVNPYVSYIKDSGNPSVPYVLFLNWG